jgi:predicted RNA-binding Zn ribbon-like protein
VVIAMPVTLPGCVTCQTGDVQHEFVTGNLALDYVATVAERGTTHVEHLVAPEDLAEWIEQAGIVDDPVAVTSAGLERAKAVREALFALVEATIDGEPVPREALRAVNEAAAAPPPRPALRDAALRREGDLDAVLSALARAALELLGGPERARVKWCAGEDCTRPFVDRSRGGRRRWCGMAGCGDRAKAAAYRARQRER